MSNALLFIGCWTAVGWFFRFIDWIEEVAE